MKTYNRRTWLNVKTSSSTSSIVAFDGNVDYGDEIYKDTFLKISDCMHSIKIHKKDTETKESFIKRLKLLSKEINLFIEHLEK
jgi:hypothetical protein